MRIDKSKIEEFPIRMECGACSEAMVLIAARVEEGFNEPSTARIEFVSDTPNIDLDDLMGQKISVIAKLPDRADRLDAEVRERKHIGICTSARFVGSFDGACHYWAEIRPKMWFLSFNKDCRIFQNMKAPDIIMEVLQDYGIAIDKQLSDTYPKRVICVQYRESDLDFVHRLMEEEGIHYFFTYDGDNEEMVLHDNSTAHEPVPYDNQVRYLDMNDPQRRNIEHFSQWHFDHAATTGKYTHTDYNFETPKARLEAFRALAKGKHDLKEREIYDYPGHYRVAADGDRYSVIRMEEQAIRYQVWRGSGIVSNIEVGGVFSVSGHAATPEGDKFVVRAATHQYQLNERELDTLEVSRFPDDSLIKSIDSTDPYRAEVTAIPKKKRFRPEPRAPWPEIAGVHTAVVTGPKGEEIHTDKYGRIRIQFHWDRLGNSDEESTCWVRCMMPWTGKNWGMVSIPRIGQEVVVQFEEGNPDRPLVVGSLYNAETMPPYGLPDNKTQSGIKSRSTKKGGADNFNELRFEDKKGSEEIYFHSEKDYKQIVENDATIEVGLSKKDKGDMKVTIHNDLTETIKEGNHTYDLEKGNLKETIAKGNHTYKVETGNVTRTISKGNESTKVALGVMKMEAAQKIELKCGGSKITLEPAKITIQSVQVEVKGNAMVKVSAPMTDVAGSAMLVLKGGLIKIN